MVNEKYNGHTRIYTDGSKKEEKVGYVVVTDQESTRRRIRDQLSTEQKAIIGAIQKLATTGLRGVIFTDSLNTMMTASGNNHTKNLDTRKITQLMDKRKENVTMCWVPGHAGIFGNEEADEEAQNELLKSRSPTMKCTHQRTKADGLRRKWRAADKVGGKRGKM
jgi:ribonuclease HI